MKQHIILTRNKHTEIRLDKKDWDVVKHIVWFTYKGEVVNQLGVRMIDYLGLREQDVVNYKIGHYMRTTN